MLVLLIINGYLQKYLFNKRNNTSDVNTLDMKNITRMKVEGMTCNHCKSNVENGAKSVAGVTEAVADLATGELTISGEAVDLGKIKTSIEALGYKVNQ